MHLSASQSSASTSERHFGAAAQDIYRAQVHYDHAVGKAFAASDLPSSLHELIKIRASQLNGCAFCIDMHTKDARKAGESEERIYLLSAWRESSLYDDQERAALALTEEITNVADGHVPDDVWDAASSILGDEQLAAVLGAIVAINGWNRIAISTRKPPGHYQPA